MEAKKSKVYSVRFDNEKLSFLQGRVKELVSGQQIVDYLLNKYWWDNKLAVVTAKEAPPLHLKEAVEVEVPNSMEASQAVLKSQITGLPPKVSMFDSFIAELNKATTIPQVEAIMGRAKGEAMFPKEKMALESHAKEISKDMFND